MEHHSSEVHFVVFTGSSELSCSSTNAQTVRLQNMTAPTLQSTMTASTGGSCTVAPTGNSGSSSSDKQMNRLRQCWKYLETILSRAKRPDCTPSCSLFPSSNSESEESDSSLSVSESGCGSPRVVATLCRTIQEMVILHASAGSYLSSDSAISSSGHHLLSQLCFVLFCVQYCIFLSPVC